MQEMQLRSQISAPRTVPCRCPASGCRAAEMVAGHLDSFNRSLRSKPFNDMMAESRARLSVESWDKLRQDWQRGCSFILENLKLRLGFFEHLPWVILGGCHHQQEVSKSQLGRAKALWDDLPPGSHALQHPLCRQLFAEGSLREELLLYIKSADPLCEYPLLERFLAPLTFVQITERIIEAAHKELGSVAAQKSTTQYSIALRVPELSQALDKRPTSCGMLYGGPAAATLRRSIPWARGSCGFSGVRR